MNSLFGMKNTLSIVLSVLFASVVFTGCTVHRALGKSDGHSTPPDMSTDHAKQSDSVPKDDGPIVIQKDNGPISKHDGALPSCTYNAKRVCWRCGEPTDSSIERLTVGCKGPQDCEVFCNNNIPDPFKYCSYGGPEDSAGDCRGWIAPKQPFSSCYWMPGGAMDGQDLYNCECVAPVGLSWMTGIAPDGTCYVFSDLCLPAGFTFGDMTWKCEE